MADIPGSYPSLGLMIRLSKRTASWGSLMLRQALFPTIPAALQGCRPALVTMLGNSATTPSICYSHEGLSPLCLPLLVKRPATRKSTWRLKFECRTEDFLGQLKTNLRSS